LRSETPKRVFFKNINVIRDFAPRLVMFAIKEVRPCGWVITTRRRKHPGEMPDEWIQETGSGSPEQPLEVDGYKGGRNRRPRIVKTGLAASPAAP
jgi:hypothetical protein